MSTRQPFIIRPASPRDESAVLALVPRLRAFESSQTLREPEALDAGELRTLRRFFAGDPTGAVLWVAEDEGAVVGMAYAERATDYFTQETHGHLGILAVAEHAEGRGIGKALLATVEQWSREAGFRFLSLNVFAENVRALGVYERAAYRADFVRYVTQLG
ncbi:MAG TPA: GNAT family N-acetyltransferase [Steroidobacteraceae bacterium]|nr:GNAT family N-acetyltransferase [Steroidobacteraceae bacterium]